MKLPQDTTIIASEKLRDYALNDLSPDGTSKAHYLADIGYEQDTWRQLEHDLRTQHFSLECQPGRPSRYGRKYEICAPLRGPNGQQRWLRTVWMIRHGETSARLITLIPEKHP